jgi:hypothetical protein
MNYKKISGNAQKAKLAALRGAHKMAKDAMKDEMGDIKKVTVAAPDKKGLKKGLDVAESILSGSKEDDSSPFEDGGMSEEESDDSMEQEESDRMDGSISLDDCDSQEEIDEAIAMLMEKKKALQK